MGCGSSTPNNSQANSLATISTGSRPTSKTAITLENKSLKSVQRANDEESFSSRQQQVVNHTASLTHANKRIPLEEISNNNNKKTSQTGMAFEVVVDKEGETVKEGSIISKHPPRRLQKLKPRIESTLTAEMIEEKQRQTEERRRRMLAEKGKSSKKSSKRRKELMVAMQFGSLQDSAEIKTRLEEKVDSASKNREKAQADIIAKQRKRELRAKQAKERVRRQNEDEDIEQSFDVERDENFMADDDVDSWLDGDNNAAIGSASSTSERIYDGRSSPVKKFGSLGKKVGQSAEFDSEGDDGQGWATRDTGQKGEKDDFFD